MVSENVFLFHAMFTGVYISFLYDILRILRRVCPHNLFFISLEDLFFWIYCASDVFVLMYRESNGSLRWFAVAGALAGILFYQRCVSPLFVRQATAVLRLVLKPVQRLAGWVFLPFLRSGAFVRRSALRIRQKRFFKKERRKHFPAKKRRRIFLHGRRQKSG